MDLFRVNEKTCRKDGICAAACPSGLIRHEKGKLPRPIEGADTECIRCGHCVTVCPTASLNHRDMPITLCSPIRLSLRVTPAQCDHLIKSRRSIRAYRNKSVPQEALTALIETARYAPTGKNGQYVEWLVFANKDELRRLTGLASDWMRWVVANEPERASLLRLPAALRRQEKGGHEVLRNAPVLIVTHTKNPDFISLVACSVALGYFDLAANIEGLGCCWAGYFMRAAHEYSPLQEALALPEGHEMLGAMMVGYPKIAYKRVPLRNQPNILWRT